MQSVSIGLLLLAATSVSAFQHWYDAKQRQNCPPMWSGNGDYCYQFFKERVTFREAMDRCSRFSSCATGVGASLVKIRSAQDESRIQNYLAVRGDPNPPNTWLGLGDPLGTGTIAWPDGTTPATVGYNNYGQGGRNGNCVLKDGLTGTWAFAPCSQMNAFVCQMDRVAPQTGTQPGARPV